jgi:Pyridoxal-dependent decarboxylase conserved domain
MDLEVRRIPVGPDFRADVNGMMRATDDDTVLIVGSAPCFPYGVFDPLSELSDVARGRGLWLHVNACVGGYLAPFARALGRPIPDFDFALPGVLSLSADLHKFGFCPKPALVQGTALAWQSGASDGLENSTTDGRDEARPVGWAQSFRRSGSPCRTSSTKAATTGFPRRDIG